MGHIQAAPTSAPVFLRIGTVIKLTGISRSTIYAWVRKGLFPAPVRIGPRASGFIQSDIEQWQRDRVTASRAA